MEIGGLRYHLRPMTMLTSGMNPDPNDLSPSADRLFKPDVTVATVVCRDGRYLMVEETVRGQRVFNQPAGHLEADESLVDAALRETLEETAWEVELTGYLGTYQWTSASGEAFLRFAFVADARRHRQELALDAGIVAAHWLSREEIADLGDRLRSPMVLRNIDDHQRGGCHPLSALHWMNGP